MDEKSGLRKIYRKSWPYDNLFGSLRFETTPAQRAVWNDLLDFAKLSRVKPGIVAPAPDVAYNHVWLAQFFNVDLELLESTLDILKSTGRINENSHGIEIINWKKYQTDYERQKPYREGKGKSRDPERDIKNGRV